MARPNQALLDLAALRHNTGIARALAPGSRLMAVVKANGYGHGAVTVARELEPLVDALAVACIEEALELREGGIESPVLLLEGVFDPAELPVAARQGFWVTVENERQLRWVEEAALPSPLGCWLKIDTGMHRLGALPVFAAEYCQRLAHSPNTAGETVLWTHLACADEPGNPHTRGQLDRFGSATAGLPGPRSAANSAGLMAWPDSRHGWVRPGYMLYGNSPFPAPHPAAGGLRPVMTLTSAVISIRDVAAGDKVGYGATWTARRPSRIATVTIGYGDGYPRHAPNGTPVLVGGRRAALAGRVSMDMITVDVTDLPEAKPGDEVVLWGGGLPVDEVARRAGTIGYELITRMPERTPRVIIRAD